MPRNGIHEKRLTVVDVEIVVSRVGGGNSTNRWSLYQGYHRTTSNMFNPFDEISLIKKNVLVGFKLFKCDVIYSLNLEVMLPMELIP